MANIDDFIDTAASSIEDYAIERTERMKVSNKASNINLATKLAVTSENPEQVEQVYRNVSADLDDGQGVDQLIDMAKSRSLQESKGALLDILVDDTIDDATKSAAANAVLDANNDRYSLSNIIATESLGADSGPEGDEAEGVRVSFAQAIGQLNEYKKAEQSLLNRAVAATDPSAVKAFADIFEFMVPFVEMKFSADVLNGMRDGQRSAFEKAADFLTGSSKKGVRQIVQDMPVQDRLAMAEKLVSVVTDSKNITLMNENDFAAVEMFRTVLEDGYYEDERVFIDNIVGILDMTILGKPISRSLRSLRGLKAPSLAQMKAGVDSYARDIVKSSVRSNVQPGSVSQIYQNTNPSKAKAAHHAAASDASDEMAEALYGTSRTEAIADDLSPEMARLDGSVRNKVKDPDSILKNELAPDADLIEFAKRSGHTEYSFAEKAQARTKIVNDMEQVFGAGARKEMTTFKDTEYGVRVSSVYGPSKSGYHNPIHAVEMTEFAFRDFGVTRKDMTILRRDGDRYTPVSMEEALEYRPNDPADFLVQVDFDYKFDPNDVVKWDSMDPKYNFFDRLPIFTGKSGQGSFQQMILDPASTFPPLVVGAANRSVDKGAAIEKMMLSLAGSMAEKMKKLEPGRSDLLTQIMKEQNANKRVYSYTELVAQGIKPKEIEVLKEWKTFWDTEYILENRDLARSMRARGYKEFMDVSTGTRLIVKPRNRATLGHSASVYDPVTDSIVIYNKADLDKAAADGKVFGELDRPMHIGDGHAEFIISEEAPGRSFTRAITDDTQVLNYTEGYYPVKYKEHIYIDEIVKDSRGNVLYTKAVGTAGNTKDAELLRERMRANKTEGEFVIRKGTSESEIRGQDAWDLARARGRTSQRVRGQRLEGSTSAYDDPSQAPIYGPVDTMIHSARSISQRVSMRDWIETNKVRFEAEWGDLLPKGKFGNTLWPANVEDIKYQGIGDESGARIADARTSWGYINYMENGYVNSLDNGYKFTLKKMSEFAGEKKFTRVEKAAQAASELPGPTGLMKGTAFNLYLAANPLRQILVQGFQMTQLAVNYPRWFASQAAMPDMMTLISHEMGFRPPQKWLQGVGHGGDGFDELGRRWRESGLSASIDKSNLLKGALLDLVDSTGRLKGPAVLKPLGFAMKWSRKVGFDAGENINMMTAWLAARDRAVRQGKDMKLEATWDNIAAEARNYTYNMTKSGDMPYNQNSLAIPFQFFQVPHKFLTTIGFNRQLSKVEKIRLALFNSIFWTLPPASMYALFGEILPENETARDMVVEGMGPYMFNLMMRHSLDENFSVDWSSLSPLDAYGTLEFIHGLLTADIGTMMAESPSGQLFFGHNPKITNFAKSVAKFTHHTISDQEDPVKFSKVARDAADLFSGMSNGFKAMYAFKYGEQINTLSGITDPEVTQPEAMARLFGFRTMDEVRNQWIKEKMYKDSQAMRDDVERWYKDTKRDLSKEGITTREYEYIIEVRSKAWMAFGNDNFKAREMVSDLISKDVRAGQESLVHKIMNMYGVSSASDVKLMLDNIPDYDEAKKAEMKAAIDFMENMRVE